MVRQLGGSMVELIVTFSKRALETCYVTQVCCIQSPCPGKLPELVMDRKAWSCKESDLTEWLNWTESLPVKESMSYFVKIIQIIWSVYLFIYLLTGVVTGNSLQYFCLENSMVGYSLWDCKELDMTECTHTHTHTHLYVSIYLSLFYICRKSCLIVLPVLWKFRGMSKFGNSCSKSTPISNQCGNSNSSNNN